MNLCVLKGRLGSDPELKYTAKGTAVAKFSLAVPDKLEPKNKEKTFWANLIVWGKLAEVCSKWLSKGQEALFTGRLSRSSWEKDGVKHYRDEIIADSMEFCGSGTGGARQEEPEEDFPF